MPVLNVGALLRLHARHAPPGTMPATHAAASEPPPADLCADMTLADESQALALAAAGDHPTPEAPSAPHRALWHWIAENHRRNRLLWAQEDLARRTQAGDAEIVANKRAIDRHNQARNDAVERIDDLLLALLHPLRPAPGAGAVHVRLHSETPGAMIDRLSILSLKVAAMQSRAAETALDEGLRAQCAARVPILCHQRDDLAECLHTLLVDVAAGRARFALYRQFKMYNDPRLNPVLAKETARGVAGRSDRGGSDRGGSDLRDPHPQPADPRR